MMVAMFIITMYSIGVDVTKQTMSTGTDPNSVRNTPVAARAYQNEAKVSAALSDLIYESCDSAGSGSSSK